MLDYLRRVIDGERTSGIPDEVKLAGQNLNWEALAPPSVLRAVEAAERASAAFPPPYRAMPTRLGNTLRSGEDRLRNVGRGTLRTFVIRHWDQIPAELRFTHDQYRTRLDMYCVLVFVAMTLGVGGGAVLLTGHRHLSAAIVTLVLGVTFALACYRAAISAAQGYVSILLSIDRLLAPAPAE